MKSGWWLLLWKRKSVSKRNSCVAQDSPSDDRAPKTQIEEDERWKSAFPTASLFQSLRFCRLHHNITSWACSSNRFSHSSGNGTTSLLRHGVELECVWVHVCASIWQRIPKTEQQDVDDAVYSVICWKCAVRTTDEQAGLHSTGVMCQNLAVAKAFSQRRRPTEAFMASFCSILSHLRLRCLLTDVWAYTAPASSAAWQMSVMMAAAGETARLIQDSNST